MRAEGSPIRTPRSRALEENNWKQNCLLPGLRKDHARSSYDVLRENAGWVGSLYFGSRPNASQCSWTMRLCRCPQFSALRAPVSNVPLAYKPHPCPPTSGGSHRLSRTLLSESEPSNAPTKDPFLWSEPIALCPTPQPAPSLATVNTERHFQCLLAGRHFFLF